MVSDDDVKYVAKLARLKIEGDELGRYVGQLSGILEHIAKISELELSQVEPTSHVVRLSNVFREDKTRPSVSSGLALSNSPEVEQGAFKVPPILDSEEEI